ncbi:hypothetical protein SCLCIDRAFT_286040 [Scleroderma citrinum Foug A]|uniref:Uncharacterized protein n=1 Tax=Scleroderma citrinum Foug A TaxID=1036808 RepID=A0A0C3DI58_9AGAM|nr:hypothetical protein SCLCIDRAFT_286040 [Scleroderma citrinum Foug A]
MYPLLRPSMVSAVRPQSGTVIDASTGMASVRVPCQALIFVASHRPFDVRTSARTGEIRTACGIRMRGAMVEDDVKGPVKLVEPTRRRGGHYVGRTRRLS